MLALTGCGFANPADYPFRCDDNVFTEVLRSHAVDCRDSQVATDLASQLLRDSGQWDSPHVNHYLIVRDELKFQGGGNWYFGYTTLSSTEVGYKQNSLVHELIHSQEIENCDFIGGMGHAGWADNGKFAVATLFVYVFTGDIWPNGGRPICDPEYKFGPGQEDRLRQHGWGPYIDERRAKVVEYCYNVQHQP
jgi:hypothetical protein